MNNKNTDFPQYRVLSNKKSWFKIINTQTFIEVQQMGSKFLAHTVEAKQYPELLRIQDMLLGVDGLFVESTEQEFLHVLRQSENTKDV
jgi:hypothetical protein